MIDTREIAQVFQRAELFRDWLSKYAVPISDVPPLPIEAAKGDNSGATYSFCLEGIDIFFDWWDTGEFVFGKPRAGNAADVRVDQRMAYKIPRLEFQAYFPGD